MPPGIETLVNYGVAGVFMLFTLWAVVQASRWCFSRDCDKPGYVTQVVDAHLKNQHKQGEFLDALAAREVRQQELCELHNSSLARVTEAVVKHDELACAGWHDVRRLKAAAKEACGLARSVATRQWPESVEDVNRHCDRIEGIIDQV